jgi:hypothetical protein
MTTLSSTALAEGEHTEVVFRLYVAGEAPNSTLALNNLKSLCHECYGESHRIDVVDVLLSPERAWAEGITVTPMTVRVFPTPVIYIIGNLSDDVQVRVALNIAKALHG